jgi:hypothetical protein
MHFQQGAKLRCVLLLGYGRKPGEDHKPRLQQAGTLTHASSGTSQWRCPSPDLRQPVTERGVGVCPLACQQSLQDLSRPSQARRGGARETHPDCPDQRKRPGHSAGRRPSHGTARPGLASV